MPNNTEKTEEAFLELMRLQAMADDIRTLMDRARQLGMTEGVNSLRIAKGMVEHAMRAIEEPGSVGGNDNAN